MKNKPWIVMVLFLLSVTSAAAEDSTIETWTCTANKLGSEVLAIAYVEKGRETGYIKVAGVIHDALFQITGFDRRWNFGLDDDKYYYAFVIRPDGSAAYYDFTSTESNVKPNMNMFCEMK